jgi:hypothetical protein
MILEFKNRSNKRSNKRSNNSGFILITTSIILVIISSISLNCLKSYLKEEQLLQYHFFDILHTPNRWGFTAQVR